MPFSFRLVMLLFYFIVESSCSKFRSHRLDAIPLLTKKLQIVVQKIQMTAVDLFQSFLQSRLVHAKFCHSCSDTLDKLQLDFRSFQESQ